VSKEEKILALCAIGVALAIGLVVWAVTYRRTMPATVTRLTWQRSINIERWQTVEESDWSVPSGGRELRNYSAIHHWERYVSGSHQVCTMKTTNGKVAQSCSTELTYSSRAVYRTKYDYQIERWIVVRAPTRQGVNNAPVWPDVSDLHTSPALTIGDERAGAQVARYTVELQASGAPYAIDLPQAQWAAYRPGEPCRLVVTLFNRPVECGVSS
jgi:hypothetical protein